MARSPEFDFKSCPPHDCVCHRLEWGARGWTVRSLPGARIWNNKSKVELTACFTAARRSLRLRDGRGLSPWGGAKGLVRNETALKFDEISTVSSVKNTAFEKHYRIGDLARLWGLGRETVRKLVKDDPGVIKIRMGRKKAHTMYSVPESAAHRIHTRLLNTA